MKHLLSAAWMISRLLAAQSKSLRAFDMTIRKQPNGKWLCECYPNGRDGKRVRKQFATKGEAIAFENFTMDEVNKKPWLGEKEDRRHLSELIEQWHSLYGQTLQTPSA
jgi:hypothetical protein